MTVEDFCSNIETRMRGGFNSVVVLKVIESYKVPIHGYLITKTLDKLTDGVLYIQAGTLYPLLKKLEDDGLVTHEMVDSKKGPKRKIYRMTPDGRKALNRALIEIDDVFNAISVVRKIDWTKVHEEQKAK